ncbi:MAG: hypothetical protein JWO46_2812 [Nocardioidaceae bacterium]|nr:hypothetical protein [Nocardioidaceae bacterium]
MTAPTLDPLPADESGGDVTPETVVDAPAEVAPVEPSWAWLDGLPLALIAALTGWASLLSWRGMADEPGRYTGPLLTAALIVAVLGWAVRRTTQRWWSAVLVQLVVLALWLMHRTTGAWIPRPRVVRGFVNQLADGAVAAREYASPVSVQHPEFHLLLLAGGVLLILGVDLIACGLRQAALAGLPLLLAITIAASVLLDPVPWPVFLLTAAGWMAMLALQESTRLGSWGHLPAGTALASIGGLSARIGLVCVLIAMVLTTGLASEGRSFGGVGNGKGNGPGSITTSNPILDLRRNLRQSRDVPLVEVRTDGQPTTPSPAYLRLTVLDEFTGDEWRPSQREADTTAAVVQALPPAPGVTALSVGPNHVWNVKVDDSFDSTWLPIPFPTTALDVEDGWRYDPDTLDVVATGSRNAAGMSYKLTAYDVQVNPASVREALGPPASLRARMTDLPPGLAPVFAQTARQVTQGATNDYDRAVLLQDWFRTKGGFEYSTDPASGTGIETLERFITTDRVGYCEQFSTAMAVMARTLGIPARVAVGFLRPNRTGKGDFVFGSQSLHAWPELYFTGVGWIRFEPTPASRTGDAPSYTVPQASDNPSAAPSASAEPTTQPSLAKPSIAPQDTGSNAGGSSGPGWPVLVTVAVLLFLLVLVLGPRVVHDLRSRRRWASASSPEALADVAWTEVRDTAVDLDLDWGEEDTVRANGERVQQRAQLTTLEGRDAMRDVVRFVELTRYARPRDVAAEHRAKVRADVGTWRTATFAAVDPRQARRATWWPRSVFNRRRR